MDEFRSLQVGDFTVRYRDFTRGEFKQLVDMDDQSVVEWMEEVIQAVELDGEVVPIDDLKMWQWEDITQAVVTGRPKVGRSGSRRRR